MLRRTIVASRRAGLAVAQRLSHVSFNAPYFLARPFSEVTAMVDRGAADEVSGQSKALQDVAAAFSRLNDAFDKSWTVSSDDVMGDMRSLIVSGVRIPYTFYVDSINLFTRRNDALRTQLLLLMSQKNLSLGSSDDPANALRYSRSRPKDDLFHQLVSLAISELVARGNVDEAMRLWVRMDAAGFVTSRVSLTKIMSKIASSGKPIRDLSLVDKLHSMMVSNLWHQSPGFYVHYFSALRQYLLWTCKSVESVKGVMHRLDLAWQQVASLHSSEASGQTAKYLVHALRLQCLSAAEAACRSLPGEEAAALTSKYEKEAMEACLSLIASRATTSLGGDSKSNVLHDRVIDEMGRILNGSVNLSASMAPAPTATPASMLYAPYHSGKGSDSGAAISRELRKLTKKLKSFSPKVASDASESSVKSSGSAGASWLWTQAQAQTRRAVLGQLLSLAKRGDTAACLNLLGNFFSGMQLDSSEQSNREIEGGGFTLTDKKSPVDILHQLTEGPKNSSNRQHVTHVTRVPARSSLAHAAQSMSDAAWARYTISRVMEGLDFPETERTVREVLSNEFASKVKSLAMNHGITLGISFLAQRISQASTSIECDDWKAFESIAYDLIDSAEDHIGRTPEVYGKLVTSLSSNYSDPASVQRGLHVIYEMIAAGIAITPQTWSDLLLGATRLCSDADLNELLQAAEGLILADAELSQHPKVLLARLHALTRLGRGYKSLQLLSTIRENSPGSSGLSSDVSVMTRYSYTRIINALYYSWPAQPEEWRIARFPAATSEYILREMGRDGFHATEHTVKNLMKLFTKSAQIRASGGSSGKAHGILDQAEQFIINTMSGGYCGHAKVPVGNMTIRELIKACCSSNQDQRALRTLRAASSKYSCKINAEPWEPLIFHYCKRGMMNAAKDTLTLMTNSGIKPTLRILDAFTIGFLRNSQQPDAVENLESFYTVHNARPGAATLLTLLDDALGSGDKYQAQRVGSLIKRLYTERERECMNVSLSTTNTSLSKARAEDSRQELLKKSAENEVEEAVEQMSVDALGLLTVESEGDSVEHVKGGGKIKKDRVKRDVVFESGQEVEYLVGERFHSGPVLHAPLSQSRLIERFAEAGIEFPKY